MSNDTSTQAQRIHFDTGEVPMPFDSAPVAQRIVASAGNALFHCDTLHCVAKPILDSQEAHTYETLVLVVIADYEADTSSVVSETVSMSHDEAGAAVLASTFVRLAYNLVIDYAQRDGKMSAW